MKKYDRNISFCRALKLRTEFKKYLDENDYSGDDEKARLEYFAEFLKVQIGEVVYNYLYKQRGNKFQNDMWLFFCETIYTEYKEQLG